MHASTAGLDSICGFPLSSTGLAVVDVEDKVPLRSALLAAATALSKRPLLGRLFPREAVEIVEVDVAVEGPGAVAVRFIIGPTAPAALA
jgi:hypothetical protein